MTLESIQNGLSNLANQAEGIISNNTGAVIGGAAVGGAILGAVATGAIVSKTSSSKTSRKKRKKITHTKRGWKQDRKRFNKSQKWEVAYRKRKARKHRKSKSKRGIHYTKNGQPYKIMSNGRARFIKKSKR